MKISRWALKHFELPNPENISSASTASHGQRVQREWMPVLVNSFILPGNKNEDLVGLFFWHENYDLQLLQFEGWFGKSSSWGNKLKLITNNAIAMHWFHQSLCYPIQLTLITWQNSPFSPKLDTQTKLISFGTGEWWWWFSSSVVGENQDKKREKLLTQIVKHLDTSVDIMSIIHLNIQSTVRMCKTVML